MRLNECVFRLFLIELVHQLGLNRPHENRGEILKGELEIALNCANDGLD